MDRASPKSAPAPGIQDILQQALAFSAQVKPTTPWRVLSPIRT